MTSQLFGLYDLEKGKNLETPDRKELFEPPIQDASFTPLGYNSSLPHAYDIARWTVAKDDNNYLFGADCPYVNERFMANSQQRAVNISTFTGLFDLFRQ